MLSRLSGKVALITGASSGFGAESARQFSAAGAHLVLGARRIERLEAIRSEIKTKHPNIRVHIHPLDVTSLDSVGSFMKSLPKEMEEIDILVNNAGLALGLQPLYEYDVADALTMLDTNVKGAFFMIRAVVPGMITRKRGHIINVSSIAGYENYKNGSMYCASKHALEAMTGALRKELVTTPLRVTSICPGLCETEFSMVRFKGDEAKAKAPYKGITPLSAADVADAIVYVASRPDHVTVADMTLFPVHQASAEVVHRDP